MKRFITISAAVVLGTLAFNVTLAHASNGNKDNKNKHDSDSKHMKHDDCFKDFWKDLCYDFSHDGCHDHHGSGSSTVYHMGGSNYGPPGTPENPTPVSGTTNPPKFPIRQPFYPIAGGPLSGLHNPLKPSPTKTTLPYKLASTQLLKKLGKNQQIPTLNGGFGSFSGAVGQGVTAGLNAAGSVVGGVAKGVESVGVGVASAVGDVASGIGGAISDIF